jgi:uncharacterized protein (DUF302 family)
MHDSGRRIVLDLGFEAAVDELARAIRAEGLQTIARVDVRDHFGRELDHDFRHYVLIEAWSPELAFAALRHDLEIGTDLPTRFAVFELPDGETAIVVTGPRSPIAGIFKAHRDAPALVEIADQEADRLSRVVERLRYASSHHAPVVPAA